MNERCTLAGTPVPAPDGGDRARRRLSRWRDAHQLAETGQFDRRLAAVGLTEAGLLGLLAESRDSLAARAARPAWADFAEAALAAEPASRPVPEHTGLEHTGPERAAWQVGLAAVVAPFTELAYRQFVTAAMAEPLDGLADLSGLRNGFGTALGSTLVALACRTLVLELNVLRVTGGLFGETPEERFWSFVRQFATPSSRAALLTEYPVLARLLAQAAQQAVESWLELLRRFVADRSRIVTGMLGGSDPGELVEVTAGRGDAHQGGRSVALLSFADGARMVYKPRPLAVHVHFNDCVDWLNRRMSGLGLRRLTVLDRGEYGWVEFAEHRACHDRPAVERYYRRQGALLALLHALDGSDFHFENVIASGDQPVPVDLEALLHPRLALAGPELITGDPALPAFDASVSRVGLLPTFVFGDDGAVLDMGGNGGDAGRPMPFKLAGWAAVGTDEMRLVREQPAFPGSQNLPRLGAAAADVTEYLSEFLGGFRAAYDAIAGGRAELVGDQGLLRRFARDRVRLVARPTRVYGSLLSESTHPDVLRDALDRDQILDYLWACSADDPARQRLVEHERRDLWAGDIPFFSAKPGTRDARTSDGTRLPGLLTAPGLVGASRKIAQLGSRDRELQEWMIHASFATRRAVATRVPDESVAVHGDRAAPSRAAASADGMDPERAVAAARAVGDRLADTAYLGRGRVGWLGLQFVEEARWLAQPLGYDLYNGYPGVALFLSQLAALTGEQRYADLARHALAPVWELEDVLGDLTGPVPQVGAFSSPTGLAYALVHVAANLADRQLLAPVDPILTLIASAVPDDRALDIIDGSASCLAAMLAIGQATGSAMAAEVARRCADRLVETADPQDHGVGWHTTIPATHPLTGFSHGAAGIGWALLRYAATTGDREYAEVGLAAFRYERSCYRPDLGTWPDFRILPTMTATPTDRPVPSMHAWCHGAPGIGLARADSGHTDDPQVADDMELALRAAIADAETNLSICHGQLGNLELFTAAASGHPDWATARTALATRALTTLARLGPVCGTPGGVATPGLMPGLAGIGHGLLRLAFPDRVPSVLLLQPPRSRPC